ncbi:MAG: hypothetical protein ACSLEN_08300 [Candidatus Malihini olakiniferum]
MSKELVDMIVAQRFISLMHRPLK